MIRLVFFTLIALLACNDVQVRNDSNQEIVPGDSPGQDTVPIESPETPAVYGLSGNLEDGHNIIISGAGFGVSGPSIELFDDFESTAAIGSEIPLTSPKVGGWSSYGTYHPQYAGVAHSGSRSMQVADGVKQLQFVKTFTGATEVFASFWMRVPDGTNFPGVVSGPGSFYSTTTNEPHTIPLLAPYTVDAISTNGSFKIDLGAVDVASSGPLTKVTANPGPGQYSLSGKTYTFSPSDAGKDVQISYQTGRSAWKPIWFMDGAAGYYTDDNLFFPCWTGGNWSVASNNATSVVSGTDGQIYYAKILHTADDSNRPVTGENWASYWALRNPPVAGHPWVSGTVYSAAAAWYPENGLKTGAWWSWNGWMRVAQWYKAGTNPTADIGSAFLQALTENAAQRSYAGATLDGANRPTTLFATSNGNNVPQFDRINVPGWVYVNAGVEPVYDDVYVATGPNARARVEIGTGCADGVYSSCTNLSLATINSWSDRSISASVRAGSLAAGPGHLFVIDADGNASAGFAVVLP